MKLLMLSACGGAISLASLAAAQPAVINISGATLLETFVSSFASTNDFIDCDGDGIVTGGGFADQLAPSGGLAFGYPGTHWVVQYRVAGSVQGFQELVSFGATDCNPGVVTPPQADYVMTPGGGALIVTALSRAYSNRQRYINNGLTEGPANVNNPGAAPVTSEMNDLYRARPWTTGVMGGGIQIDISPLDVPTSWAVQGPVGAPALENNPTTPGYGRNPRLALSPDGTVAPGPFNDNLLVDLGPRRLASASMPPYPDDSNTIFDKPLAWAPIAPITNLGVGYEQVRMSDLRHMFVTGRSVSGENLMIVTRDIGSGTRNGWNNTTCTDPSWGVGDNVGQRNTLAINFNCGRTFLPSNKGGNAQVESTVQNTRLGIGYVGPERGINSPAWLSGGRLEILAVQNDLYPGVDPMTAPYNRPTINKILDNDPVNGYVIGGPAVLATIGDPSAEPVSSGGLGLPNPRMCNTAAACYVNNICRSIEAFIAVPGGSDTFFTPGEFLATQFVLTGALDFIPDSVDPCVQIVNATNPALQNYTRFNSVYTNPAFAAFGTVTRNGINPTRNALTGTDVYSDGIALGANYRSQGTAGTGTGAGALNLSYGAATLTRNRICGDFNGDGQRNINDAAEMLKAWRFRNGLAPSWIAPNGAGPISGAPGSDACPEILGDFNNDGDFGRRWNNTTLTYSPDLRDIRYWADGLGLDPVTKKLNRMNAFMRIDTEWLSLTGGASNNFFGTVIYRFGAPMNQIPYLAGNAAGDVAGPSGLTTPGFAPIGADGIVDAYDIDYVYKQFKRSPCVTDGACNWAADVDEASCTDLSADINGDLVIDQADICKLVSDILRTCIGDVNLDGTVNAADEAIAAANLGLTGGWASGDADGDGTITQDDVDIIHSHIGAPPERCCDLLILPPACPGDVNGDGMVGLADIAELITCWAQPASCNPAADLDMSGSIGLGDVAVVISNWATVCP